MPYSSARLDYALFADKGWRSAAVTELTDLNSSPRPAWFSTMKSVMKPFGSESKFNTAVFHTRGLRNITPLGNSRVREAPEYKPWPMHSSLPQSPGLLRVAGP